MTTRTLSAVATAAKKIRTALRARQVAGSVLSGAVISVTSQRASQCSTLLVRVDRMSTPEDERAMARETWAIVAEHWAENGRTRFANVIVNGRYLGPLC
ncbi:hypothetical protein ACG83_10600 [Frankia sp. R43]|uniref:hypothetical protein n=1 Tax=Frankia sp. R43 TaxID=269536 RepID=UPI0006C9F9B0|nr:hypothetical protein [Frankia sp. R43]KPM55722.1 hypothetical protein ACG83_10600 [Frankia sp. R43]